VALFGQSCPRFAQLGVIFAVVNGLQKAAMPARMSTRRQWPTARCLSNAFSMICVCNYLPGGDGVCQYPWDGADELIADESERVSNSLLSGFHHALIVTVPRRFDREFLLRDLFRLVLSFFRKVCLVLTLRSHSISILVDLKRQLCGGQGCDCRNE
jgi:hypothetical protein